MSTIIKAGGPIRSEDGMSFNFDDMGQRANQYLEQIRQDAARILAAAEQDAVQIRARAEKEGEQAALRAVERIMDEKIAQQMTTVLPALQHAVAAVQDARAAWIDHWQQAAVHTAAAIAARIARLKAVEQPQITLTLVREALELAAGSAEIELQMNPEDHAALRDQVERVAAELASLGKVRCVATPQVTRGGCRVQTRFGTIDQQFEAQIARIEQELAH